MDNISQTLDEGSKKQLKHSLSRMTDFTFHIHIHIYEFITAKVGQWGAWATWSACSQSCKGGVRSRSRSCSGLTCKGDGKETSKCNEVCCPGIFELKYHYLLLNSTEMLSSLAL